MSATTAQYLALSRRAVVNTLRQPAAVFPSLGFPLLFLAMSAAALERSIDIPGFPSVDSFLQFAFAATMIQGVLFGAVMAGTDMARDIEGGFFERLLSSPATRNAILVGRVAGAAALGFFQAWFFIGVVSIFGADIEGGPVAMLLLSLVAATLAAAVGSITAAMALRTGSSEAVQGSFPLIFIFLFISSAFFPRDLMSGWFKTVASVNPISHLVESMRVLIIDELDFGAWLLAIWISGLIFAVGLTAARLALRRRLAVSS